MGRIMMVGAVGTGKSTLVAAIQGDSLKVRKTQAIEFDKHTVDTPGEYIENPQFYRALLATALQVDYVLFLQDATKERSVYPPGIAQSFPCYTIGIVTKVDQPDADILRAEGFLYKLGLKSNELYSVSSLTGRGLEELKKRLGIDCHDKTPELINGRTLP